MKLRSLGAWLAPVLLLVAVSAEAAPRCDRVAAPNPAILPAGDRAIAPQHAACAWGIGLAIPSSGTGTAFLVGNRREVMTSLHVVDPQCQGNRRFTFSHGFEGGRAASNIGATMVAHGDYCGGSRYGSRDEGGDWAIAVLDRDPARFEQVSSWADTQPLQVRGGNGAWRDNGHYFLLGYGMSFRGGMQPYRSGGCWLGRGYSDGVVEHSCDASPRSSGAPIVIQDSAGRCLVAALQIGALAGGSNAKVAVRANRFAAAVRAVARELDQGRGARQIAADLAADPPER